ncbi:carboxymuconolactone decarboxylase family protein [Streptomyces sp. TLI_171]|uniref:carboxymuconolactone decarboxylase family protein n=1 Tax=Streptomyces sp. TLI_171 TaxID=1938859 RepID=UPI000C19C34C|nr:carboxymuconolactone decarboxylase family protein [Streptomyces sp. TLI_171]RKE17673.1 alkylhydroperoxidase/carboxymuconolactone decarboxylase family protein YurZ [Streptomyces sp. TLI_171]
MALPTRAAIERLDPVFAEMAAASFQLAEAEKELTPRERALLRLVADVCEQVLGLPFELHVRAALDSGLDADDLRELIRFVSYDSGYPAALAALERLAEIERVHGLPGPTGQRHRVNADGTGSPLPAAMRAEVQALDREFADYMDLQSRMRGDMSRIGVRERAFATMAVDVLYQTLQESFRAHVGRALGAGATPEQVRAAVRATAVYGMTRTWRAMIVLDALLAELAPA